MCGQKYGQKLVKPLKIEENGNGKKEKPKLANARRIYFIDLDEKEYKETQKCVKKTGKTYGTSHAM